MKDSSENGSLDGNRCRTANRWTWVVWRPKRQPHRVMAWLNRRAVYAAG